MRIIEQGKKLTLLLRLRALENHQDLNQEEVIYMNQMRKKFQPEMSGNLVFAGKKKTLLSLHNSHHTTGRTGRSSGLRARVGKGKKTSLYICAHEKTCNDVTRSLGGNSNSSSTGLTSIHTDANED